MSYQVSLTLAPAFLLLPMFELTGEFRVDDEIGLAFVLGGGRINLSNIDDDAPDLWFTMYDVGTQFRYYAVGDFDHGMQLGMEVLWLGVYVDDDRNAELSGTGSGLSTAPFIGYKIATRAGFTFDAQAGLAYSVISAEAESGTDKASSSRTVLSPMANLNLGWSF